MWWLPLAVILVALAAAAYVLWPRGDDETRPDRGPGAAPRAVQPESLEGVLVAQLTAAQINRRQYVRAMEQLAARDDERHPLAVPPEIGGAA